MPAHATRSPNQALPVVLVVAVVAGLLGGVLWWQDRLNNGAPEPMPTGSTAPAAADVAEGRLTYRRLANPARTVVMSGDKRVATFTDGARVVDIAGPTRTFREPEHTSATVTVNDWIRLAPRPWRKGAEKQSWLLPWLTSKVADRSPDLFAIAMQYKDGAAPKKNADGLTYAGDADFGPKDEDSQFGRDEKSDFYDYLGIEWDFPDGRHEEPERVRLGDLDCSGFVRMVFGYRMGYPMHNTNTRRPGSLPRRAYAINQYGPGTLIIRNEGGPVADYDALQPGDLVFFNTDSTPGYSTNHSGIYLGIDSTGHRRFMSSRVRANGPTFGDLGGNAVLDDGSYYSVRFRAARRL
jgi:cell wall-associated NlpC family hydrolase